MDFTPPWCPNTACSNHTTPEPNFFRRNGSYAPTCRLEPVPRFRCRACLRGFSRQTFRFDRGDRRPDANAELFRLLTSGVGLRQCSRLLSLRVSAVQRKLYKLGRQCEAIQGNLCRSLPVGGTYLIDEEETYEAASIRTLTVPVLIERSTWFVVSFAAAPIRRLAAPGTARRDWQDRDEEVNGQRRDCSKAAVYAALRRLRHLAPTGPLLLQTDEKTTYGPLIRLHFGERAVHETTSSKDARTTRNPLFPINTTLTMTRDNCGRLRPASWLVSKRRRALVAHLHVFVVYRNYVRQRFNRDTTNDTAAKILGLLPRNMSPEEVVGWGQREEIRCVHPLSKQGAVDTEVRA